MQVVLMAAMTAANLAAATSTDLNWSDHYANAKVQAAAEQRPLLVILEDSTDPDGRFDQDRLVAADSQVELLKHYRLCRMDVKTDYGQRVAEAFGAKKFPFTAITDKSAKFITFRSEDDMSPEQWEQTLTASKDGQVVLSEQPAVQRVEASKIMTEWPTDAYYPATDVYTVPSRSVPSNCPNCIRNQFYR